MKKRVSICCLKSQYKKGLPVGIKYFLSDMKEWENVMEYKEYFTQNTGRGRQTHCSTQWVGGGDG